MYCYQIKSIYFSKKYIVKDVIKPEYILKYMANIDSLHTYWHYTHLQQAHSL
jgi:hypothetical protein